MNRITMELNADEMILLALKEDITFGDISSDAVLPKAAMGSVELIAKQDGVIAGLPVFKRVFELIDGSIDIKLLMGIWCIQERNWRCLGEICIPCCQVSVLHLTICSI